MSSTMTPCPLCEGSPDNCPNPITAGYTDQVDDCVIYESGINMCQHLQRIVCYGNTAVEAMQLRDQVMEALISKEKLRADDLKSDPVAYLIQHKEHHDMRGVRLRIDPACHNVNEEVFPLMTVAQHEQIVAAVMANQKNLLSRLTHCASDLLERLLNATEDLDDLLDVEEIAEVRALIAEAREVCQ